MEKVCLVLEGGGNRGVYTSGVLDAFLDNNIFINNVYGVSAGALNALSYLSRQKGRSLKVIKEHLHNKECVNFKRALRGKSIINLDYLFSDNIDQFDLETFNENQNLVVICTNVVNGAPIYKKIENYNEDIEYIKASASLPLFSKIITVDGLKLLDGGLSDSIPVVKALSDGYDKVIVVLTRDKDFVCKPYSFMGVYKAKYYKYPKFIKTMENRYNKYNVTRDLIVDLEEKNRFLAIYPSEELSIGHLEKDSSKIDSVYNLGYQDALKMIETVKTFIGGRLNEKRK